MTVCCVYVWYNTNSSREGGREKEKKSLGIVQVFGMPMNS